MASVTPSRPGRLATRLRRVLGAGWPWVLPIALALAIGALVVGSVIFAEWGRQPTATLAASLGVGQAARPMASGSTKARSSTWVTVGGAAGCCGRAACGA